MNRANCLKCKHFYITWDQSTPRGCKLYQIQSQQYPSLVVAANTAEGTCIGFEAKEIKVNKDQDSDSDYGPDFY